MPAPIRGTICTARLHSDALDALGDANRRAIVEILSAAAARSRRSRTSYRSAVLPCPAISGCSRTPVWSVDEVDGVRRIYALRADGVEAIRQYFAETWGTAIARLRIVSENTTPREVGPGRDDR